MSRHIYANGKDVNAKRELIACSNWFDCMNGTISDNLKSAEDGIKLWRYWQARPNIPEFCDNDSQEFMKGATSGEYDVPERHGKEKLTIREHRIAALGYDPEPEED